MLGLRWYTHQKLVCDFLLMNNTNLHLILLFQLRHSIDRIIAYDRRFLSLGHSLPVIAANIAINEQVYSPNVNILPKLDYLYIFVADNTGIASTNLTQLALKSNAFIVITHIKHRLRIRISRIFFSLKI